MGCGASNEKEGKVDLGGKGVMPKEVTLSESRVRKKRREKDNEGEGTSTRERPRRRKCSEEQKEGDLPGRAKYLPHPLINIARDAKDADGRDIPGQYQISCFSHISELKGITIAVRESESGHVHAVQYSDAELISLRNERALKHNWLSFFRALSSAFSKGNPKVRKVGGVIHLDIMLSSTKEPKHQQFNLELQSVGDGQSATQQYFLEPFVRYYNKQPCPGSKRPSTETKYWLLEATAENNKLEIELGTRQLTELKAELAIKRQSAEEIIQRTEKVKRQMRNKRSGTIHYLDKLYYEGVHTFLGHTPHAANHESKESQPVELALKLLDNVFSNNAAKVEAEPAILMQPPTDSTLLALVENAPDKRHWDVMKCLVKLDKWDYDVFELDECTNGGSLFHTAYALFHKYGLIEYFNLEHETLVNFLLSVQAGYRANSYHNSSHAADVLQICHYILGPAGLCKLTQLSKEDMLASLIAAAIHDYDHPGFNNNFHTKTGAYLATLYSDKSILENHHCACVFEMMQSSKFDILQSLNEDQRRDVRDTVVEMVISTDMGNHAKLYSTFKRRLNESDDWVSKKEDTRLTLVMAIKTADISNCGRPQSLYLKWASNIAHEFYLQGDVEQMLSLAVSPFMDRRKDKTDFSRGQVSFINFIVIPLFESMAELLPGLDFTIRHCTDNKDRWQQAEGSGAVS